MNKAEKKFRLPWVAVILVAVLMGIYTGIIAMVPSLRDTSFQDISISFEWWILFGVLIILGSKSNIDAALKCFVFFLISQPLVYLVQIVFGNAEWEIFGYYKTWLIWTILTLPMGYVGYYLKKDKWWGLFIMLPIWILLGWHVNNFLRETIAFFPNHLFSLIFCIVTMFLYVFMVFKHRRERIIGSAICAIIVAVCAVLNILSGQNTYNTTIMCSNDEVYFDGEFDVEMDEKYGTVRVVEKEFDSETSFCVDAEFRKTGMTTIRLQNGEKSITFDLEIGRNTFDIEKRAE